MRFRSLVCILIIFVILSGCSVSNNGTFYAMNTYIDVTVHSNNNNVIKQIESEVKRLESLFSVTKKNSEIALLNENGTVKMSKDTKNILKRAMEISKLTNGAFDITVYPVVSLWGFTTNSYRVPSDEEIKATLSLVDYNKLIIKDSEAKIQNGKCDLGAIAKGYAGSKIREILVSNNIDSAVISLGGNVVLHGTKPDGTEWNVGIQHPITADDLIGTVKASNVSVVTSGGYQRYFDSEGKRYHHIIDTRTGYPADNGIISATVITTDDTAADALATSLYVLGKEEAEKLWKEQQNFEMILVTDTDIFITKGLENKFRLNDNNFKLNIIT